jgi:hypothetical protein
MDPLTLKLLASLIQLHGGDATVASDNKGIDQLLGDVRQLLDTDGTAPVIKAAYDKGGGHHEVLYHKVYEKTYDRWVAKPGGTSTGPTAPPPPKGGTK